MWLKFVFAFAYVFILLTFSRIVNVAFKSGLAFLLQQKSTEANYNASNMTTKQLKSVLDQRGIPYDNLIEKQEYKQLILASGPLDADEVDDSLTEDASQSATAFSSSDRSRGKQMSFSSFNSQITSRGHFYEMVEDTKDSAWLILVLPFLSSTASAFTLSASNWWTMINKLSKFGIRIAVFDCSNDMSFCASRNWRSARFILSLPKNHDKAKSDVIVKQYLLSNKVVPSSIFRWVHSELASRVTVINSISHLKTHWLTKPPENELIGRNQRSRGTTNVIYVSNLRTPPLSVSGLAVKFNGIANISMIDEKLSQQLAQVIPGLGVSSMLVTLANGSYYVCHSCKTFTQMNLILKTLLPDMNDVFSFSLYLINISVVIHFFWFKCLKSWTHITFWLMEVIKVNCLLFLSWLAILALYRFTYFKCMLETLNLAIQMFSSSFLGEAFRQDFNSFTQPTYIAASIVTCGCFFYWLRRYKLTSHSSFAAYDDDQLFRDWAPLESTMLNYLLFRPMNSVSAVPSNTVELHESIELLIERLAVPNLWLQADLWSNEYIKNLPLWLHPGNGTSSEDSSSDLDGNANDSERPDTTEPVTNTCINCTPTSTSFATPSSSHTENISNSPIESCSVNFHSSSSSQSNTAGTNENQTTGSRDSSLLGSINSENDQKLRKKRQPAAHVPPGELIVSPPTILSRSTRGC